MFNKQVWLAVLVVTLFIALMAATAYLERSRGGFRSPLSPEERFTARPGTTRAQAVALSSNKRPSQANAISEASRAVDHEAPAPAIPVKPLSPPAPEESGSPAERQIEEALDSLAPEAGLDSLRAALAENPPPDEAALLHAAMGLMFARLDPPDFGQAEEAFIQAAACATTPECRQRVLVQEVRVLLQSGAADRAREKIAPLLEEGSVITVSTLHLGLMLGQLDESAGALDAAAGVYQQLLDRALAEYPGTDPESEDLLRVMALHLARLYRELNRDAEAEALAQRVAPVLGKGEVVHGVEKP